MPSCLGDVSLEGKIPRREEEEEYDDDDDEYDGDDDDDNDSFMGAPALAALLSGNGASPASARSRNLSRDCPCRALGRPGRGPRRNRPGQKTRGGGNGPLRGGGGARGTPGCRCRNRPKRTPPDPCPPSSPSGRRRPSSRRRPPCPESVAAPPCRQPPAPCQPCQQRALPLASSPPAVVFPEHFADQLRPPVLYSPTPQYRKGGGLEPM